MTSLFFSYSFLVKETSACGCEQKSLYDNNGGGQREKVKRVEQVLRWHCIFHPQLRVENRDMCSTKESNELFSDQEIGKTRMLQCEESRQNPSRSFWARRKWGRRSIWTKSRKGVRKREWQFQGDSEGERGWCSLERSSGKITLRVSVMWGTPIIPCVCYWDGRGFLAGFMRASSSSVRKVEKGVRREECENSREFMQRKGVDFFGEI